MIESKRRAKVYWTYMEDKAMKVVLGRVGERVKGGWGWRSDSDREFLFLLKQALTPMERFQHIRNLKSRTMRTICDATVAVSNDRYDELARTIAVCQCSCGRMDGFIVSDSDMGGDQEIWVSGSRNAFTQTRDASLLWIGARMCIGQWYTDWSIP